MMNTFHSFLRNPFPLEDHKIILYFIVHTKICHNTFKCLIHLEYI